MKKSKKKAVKAEKAVKEDSAKSKEKKKPKSTRKIVLGIIVIVLIAIVVYLLLNRPEVAGQTDIVRVDYILSVNGTVLDTSIASVAKTAGIYNENRNYQPIEATLGAGKLVPGFEDAIYGMKEGETKKVSIPPERAYGLRDPTKIATFPLSAVNHSEEIVPGMILSDGNGNKFRVFEVNATHAFVDLNHPLAGKTLDFEITLVKIKD